MKFLIVLLHLIFLSVKSFPQGNDVNKLRLLGKIRSCDYIESYCLGDGCNSYSELYRAADSLLNNSSIEDALVYFNDSSYSLKYYSFLHIQYLNDSLAFDLLKKNIHDKKNIDYQFADLFSNTKFIYLIVGEYRDFIKSKYLYGGRQFRDHQTLNFPPKNKAQYKRRNKELDGLLHQNNIVVK